MPKYKPAEEIERLRMPKSGEVLGLVEEMFGFDRARVRCRDGHVRNARIRERSESACGCATGTSS